MYNPNQGNQLVSFYDKDVINNFKTSEAKKPVYETKTYVKIDIPFREKDSVNRPKLESDEGKYPAQWEAYQNSEKLEQDGTVIDNWNYPNESQIKMLKSSGVRTVEQVAAIDDGVIKRLGTNGRRLRDMARAFIEQGDAADLRNQILDMQKQIDELNTPKKKVKKDDSTNGITERSE